MTFDRFNVEIALMKLRHAATVFGSGSTTIRGLRLTWVAAGLLLASTSTAWSAQRVEVESVRVGFGDANVYRLGAWTPVWVQVRGGDARFSGVMEVAVEDDDGAQVGSPVVVDVGAGETKSFVAYVRAGTSDPRVNVTLFDQNGRRQGSPFDSLAQGTSTVAYTPVQVDDALVLTIGNTLGVELIPAMQSFKTNVNATTSEVTVAKIDVGTGFFSFPGRALGFDGARAVVLDTNARDAMTALAGGRGQSLVEWVRQGGHLVLAVGSNWQAAADSFLAELLPGKPTGSERVNDLAAVDVFAGGNKQVTPPGTPAVSVTRFNIVRDGGAKVLAATADLPLVVRAPFGFGRVTLITFDVDQKPFAAWADRGEFWVRALDLRRLADENSTAGKPGQPAARFYRSGYYNLASRLRGSLEQFKGIRLVPFGWVAFFIFIYILLIGPGDYFFLKKVLRGRMELTWITFPALVIVVSVAAYYAAYLIKGTKLRVNKVDVVDVDQADGIARGYVFFDLFSPLNRAYDVEVAPFPLDKLADTKSAASVRPAGDDAILIQPGLERRLSWMGSPEPGFGGIGARGGVGMGSPYGYAPVGGVESLRGVRVPIWSTRSLEARWFATAPKLIDSDLTPAGPDRLIGTVTNNTGLVLKDAILVHGKQQWQLDDIAPGATVRVETKQDRQISGYLTDKLNLSSGVQMNGDGMAFGDRIDLIRGMMFHDAIIPAANQTPIGNTYHDIDLSGLLALERPMLVAVVDHPATQVVLPGSSSLVESTQTTLLRVVLKFSDSVPKTADAGTPSARRPHPAYPKSTDHAVAVIESR